MSEPLRDLAVFVLAGFVLIQGIVLLQLLLTVQQHMAPATLGPEVGRWIARVPLQTIDGPTIVFGASGRVSVLVFVAPGCGACHALTPVLRQFVRMNRTVDVSFLGAGDESRNRDFARHLLDGIPDVPYVVLPTPQVRVREFGVRTVPYVIVLDTAGVVAAGGYVPSQERLAKVIEAARLRLSQIVAVSPASAPSEHVPELV